MAFLLDHLPDQLHLVIATRADPPLPLARLRSRGQLVEVRAADLRFTPDEAAEFLNQAMGLDLSRRRRATRSRSAPRAGSPGCSSPRCRCAASPSAATSPTSSRRSPAATGSSSTTSPTRCWPANPHEVRDFLLRTAVLDRLTGPLCDAVTGRDRRRPACWRTSSAPTSSSSRSTTERTWYRYHHLFADVLQRTAARRAPRPGAGAAPAGQRLVRRRTASPPTRSGTRSPPRTSTAPRTWSSRRCPRCAAPGRTACCWRWVRALPDAVVRRSPVLSIVSGWATLMAGDLDGVEPGSTTPKRRWPPAPRTRTLAAHVGGHRGPAHRAGDDRGLPRLAGPGPRRRRRHRAPRPARRSTWPAPRTTSSAAPGAGSSAWPPGRRETSRRRCRHVLRGGPQPARRGEPGRRAGRHGRARRHVGRRGPAQPRPPALRASAADGHGNGEPYPRATADLHVGLAELDRELDDLRAPRRTSRPRASSPSGPPSPRTGTGGPSPWRRCAPPAATSTPRRSLLDEAEALYRPGFYPDVRPIAAMRARVRIAAGRPRRGRRWAASTTSASTTSRDYLREYEHLTLVRLLLARHAPGDGTPPRRSTRSRCWTGCTPRRRARTRRQRARDPHAAGPRPRRRRRPGAGARRARRGAGRGARAGQLRPAVPRRGRPDAGPAAATPCRRTAASPTCSGRRPAASSP